MTTDDIKFSDAPTTGSFWKMFQREYIRWAVYQAKDSIEEEDLPIGDKWWIILYWLPRIKKELYELLLKRGMFAVEHRLFEQLGIDQFYFYTNFGFFIKRLNRMKKLYKASPHLGETI